MTNPSTETESEQALSEPLDAWSAKLVRKPLANAQVDVICISTVTESSTAENSSGVETIRRKGRLGSVIGLHLDETTEIGPAIQSAISRLSSPLVVFTDSHSEWNRDIIDRLLKAINSSDLAIGARPAQSLASKYNRTIAATLRGWFWGAGVLDPLSPYKIARSEFLKKFPLQSKSHFAEVEIIAKCNFLDALIHEEILPAAPAWIAPNYSRRAGSDKRTLFQNPHFKIQSPEHEPSHGLES
ncbi:MAG: glycosyltransferase [Planctomycetota bacterium]|nr:MAG: glycosyltransferase [Planctomycetota bacterium]